MGKAFNHHLAKKADFSKTEEFLAQKNCDKTMKRVVLRYFWRELVLKGALEPNQLPIRLQKWTDTSNSECIFTDSQRRRFSRHHLLQCPWYLELNDVDPTPGEEVQHRARCEAMTISSEDDGMLSSSVILPVAQLTEKAKEAAAAKAAKQAAKAKEKEALRQERETTRTLKKETRERNKELAALVAREGPEKLISQLGGISRIALPAALAPTMPISPSASSRPSTIVTKPSQTVYSIPAIEHMESTVGVKVMCQSAMSIMPLFDSIAEEGDDPALFTEMREFLKEYSGTRVRRREGKDCDLGLADMVLLDIPEDLPVPGIGAGVEVPSWNMLPTRLSEHGKVESHWIQNSFEMASFLLRDGGPFIVFYPDSKFISNELQSWANWADFVEETKWFCINGLPLSRVGHPGRTLKLFMVKCFVRKLQPHVPITFFDRMELQREGIMLSSDGHMTNLITLETMTMKVGNDVPWRGAREKTSNLMEALIDLCTQVDDVVLDLTASTGEYDF